MNNGNDAPLYLLDTFPSIPDESWRGVAEADLKGADFDKKLVWQTFEGLKVQPWYRAPALDALGYLESVPGQQPWLRGHSPAGNAWSIVQEIALPKPRDANAAAKEALAGGANALCFVCVPASSGVHGVSLQSLEDMETALHGLSLNGAALHFQGRELALPLFGNLLAALRGSGIDAGALEGSIDYDPLATLVRQGSLAGSRNEVFFQVSQVLEQSAVRLPRMRALTIQGDIWLEAGGSAVQEIAFTLASLSSYLEGLRERGVALDLVLPRLQVQFAVGSTYFMEIAKLRAARLLISRVIEAYMPQGQQAPAIPILARGATFNQTVYDPHTNLLRATTAAMAAAIGGASAILVPAFDETYRTSDDTALRLSRNIQLLLKHEAHFDKVADPASGSYLFETLTDSLAAASWKLFQQVEAMGGFLAAASNGFLHREVAAVAARKRQAIASRRQSLLGVNQYPNLKETALDRVHPQPATTTLLANRRPFEIDTSEGLFGLRAAFEAGAVLSDVLKALEKPERLLAHPIRPFRAAQSFESIRLETERYAARTGRTPVVFLLKSGSIAMRQARAGFVTNFFGCAGFSIADSLGFVNPLDGVEAAVKEKAEIVVLCSADDEYLPLATAVCPLLKQQLPHCQIVVAGYPKDILDDLRKLGVDDFVHIRSVAEDALKTYQEKLGIRPQADPMAENHN